MIPTLAIRDQAMKLLAADTTTLAPAMNAIYMALVKAPLVPTEQLTFADITLATFDGSTPIALTVGSQPEGLDPVTTDSVIDLSPPAGGFRWITTGTTDLPQTIYGYVLLDHAKTTLYAAETLDVPITLTATGQRIDIGDANLNLAAGSIS
jgi:hypothetical protein